MSTPLAGTSTPSQRRHWQLSLPKDMMDDSFSRDLIQMFDKKQSRLLCEIDNDQESSRSIQEALTSPSTPVQITIHNPKETQPPNEMQQPVTPDSTAAIHQRRRQSAGDLLRRSSAYLRSKLDGLKGLSRSHDNLRDYQSEQATSSSNPHGSSSILANATRPKTPHVDSTFFATPSSTSLAPPAKIAVNTTITLPQFSKPGRRHLSPGAAAIQPPFITEFPPKPLKYSPVEPLSDEPKSEHHMERLMHRISLPILRRDSNQTSNRRQSDAGVQRMSSIGRKAKRIGQAMGCLESSMKKKGKERVSKSAAPIPPLNTSPHSLETGSSSPPSPPPPPPLTLSPTPSPSTCP